MDWILYKQILNNLINLHVQMFIMFMKKFVNLLELNNRI
jgi:hypothetical protein